MHLKDTWGALGINAVDESLNSASEIHNTLYVNGI